MDIRRIVPAIYSNQIEKSKDFYLDFLGMELAMDLEWVWTFVSKSNPTAQVNLIKSDKKEAIDNAAIFLSIEVSDVDEMYQKAKKHNCDIIYEIRDEPWGVRRFFVKDPNMATINLLSHNQQAVFGAG